MIRLPLTPAPVLHRDGALYRLGITASPPGTHQVDAAGYAARGISVVREVVDGEELFYFATCDPRPEALS